MSHDRRSIIEKVDQLFRLAGNNPSEEEAKSAAARAQELISKHRISTYELAPDNEFPGYGDIKKKVILTGKRFPKWIPMLLDSIARQNNCEALRLSGGDRDDCDWILIGTQTDSELCQRIFEYVRTQIIRLAEKKLKERQGSTRKVETKFFDMMITQFIPYDNSNFRTDYCFGLCIGISQILKATNEKAQEQKAAGVHGLIKIEKAVSFWSGDWKDLLDKYKEENWNEGKELTAQVKNKAAARAGINDAKKVDLGLQENLADKNTGPILLTD